MRCTEATLTALGIEGKAPVHGTGVLSELTRAGMKWTPVIDSAGMSVKKFMEENPTGRFYLSTAGHAMALIDGALTDTAGIVPSRRKLVAVIRIDYP